MKRLLGMGIMIGAAVASLEGIAAAEGAMEAPVAVASEIRPEAGTVGVHALEAPDASPAEPKATGAAKLIGLGSIKDQQTVITSASIEFDYKEMVAVFEENVRVENPQFLMLADRVLVFLDGTNDVKQILALGRVSVTNEIRSGSCDKAVYTRATDQIVLTGHAELRRGGDYVTGDRIVIWLNDERMEVSPGVFVITPGTIKEQETPVPVADGASRQTSENSPNKRE